jgi:hypothetical protein
MERFERTLEREEVALRETIASLLQEVKSPALLELDATPDEVKPTLVKHPKRLHKSCFLWLALQERGTNQIKERTILGQKLML